MKFFLLIFVQVYNSQKVLLSFRFAANLMDGEAKEKTQQEKMEPQSLW